MNIFYFGQKIRYKITARYHHGHGIHSPSLYALVRSCIFHPKVQPVFPDIKLKRREKKIASIVLNTLNFLGCRSIRTQFSPNSHYGQILSNNNIELHSLFSDGYNDKPTVSFIHSSDLETNMPSIESMLRSFDFIVLFILDIHNSSKVHRVWSLLIEQTSGVQSIDLFHLGIIVKRPGIRKEHFLIRYF